MRQIVRALRALRSTASTSLAGLARRRHDDDVRRDFDLPVAFPPQSMARILAEVVSALGMTMFRTAETEKYAHVTYFFNGGVEPPYPGEERILVPSQKVATYDLAPEMSAAGVTDVLCGAIGHAARLNPCTTRTANGRTQAPAPRPVERRTVDRALAPVIRPELPGTTARHG